MDYQSIFEKRANSYQYAIEKYPLALQNEFYTAIDMCDIKRTDILLNILSGGNPLEKYFKIHPQKYVEYEINKNFVNINKNINVCSIDSIPESTNSVDTVITIASLHHFKNEERYKYYKECHRILKENTGKFIVADVMNGSKEEFWLNTFVDKYNSYGHKGVFFSESDKNVFEMSGFQTEIVVKTYPWIFKNELDMIDFMRNLFGLDLATTSDILNGVNSYLKPIINNTEIHIQWSLMYFTSIKRHNSFQSHL